MGPLDPFLSADGTYPEPQPPNLPKIAKTPGKTYRYTAEMVKLEASLAEMERELTRAEAAHMRERRELLDREAAAVADQELFRSRTILLQGEVGDDAAGGHFQNARRVGFLGRCRVVSCRSTLLPLSHMWIGVNYCVLVDQRFS